jgi:lysophospholipid acyltransferase 7
MVMTLKIIGLAFERDSSITKAREDKNGDKKSVLTSYDEEIQKITFINMFHYCFNYIGLLTGEKNLLSYAIIQF